jgi:putative endonuclease
MEKRVLGAWGERMAEKYLKTQGYNLIARNFRLGRAEIDLLMDDGMTCVLVEVKTRKSNHYGFPEEAVSGKKAEVLGNALMNLLDEFPRIEKARIDVISITGFPKNYELVHWVDFL